MRSDKDGDCFLADADETWEGWEVIARAPHKDGVDVVHIRTVNRHPAQFCIVYQSTANNAAGEAALPAGGHKHE
jgi:hypothetical protein